MAMNSIITNYGAQVALQALNKTSDALAATQKRVSTGLRVADGRDDGAAFAVAERVRGDIAGATSANEQLGGVKGLLAVTSSALQNVSTSLQALKALAVKIGDGNITADQRTQYQSQALEITNNIRSFINDAGYNSKNIINAAGTNTNIIINGAGDNYTITAYNAITNIHTLVANANAYTSTTAKAAITATGAITNALSNTLTRLNSYGGSANYIDNQINFNKSKIDALEAGMGDAKPHLLIAHRLAPDDGYVAHLAASAGAFLPERADAQYVGHIFDGYAAGFEVSLLGLGYRAPGLILRQFEALLPGLGGACKLRNLLDLGCGTGLVGLVLHDVVAGAIKGVDLSAGMLQAARAKGIYTELQQAEIDAALLADQEQWHAIVAADVFIYFGALEATLAAIAQRLAPDGWLVFTTEALEGPQAWDLAETGRFRHSEVGLLQALATAGLEPMVLRREALRREGTAVLDGFLVAARRAA